MSHTSQTWHKHVRLRQANEALYAARTYAQWQEAAGAIDAQTGAAAWRDDAHSDAYDATSLREDIHTITEARRYGDDAALARALHDSVARHALDLTDLRLYSTALGGTKHLVTHWLDTVCQQIDHLAGSTIDPSRRARRVHTMQREATALGQTALMLSGGATLGFIHLGVVKALFEASMLPTVISGASMGAMIATGIGTRNDVELQQLFKDPTAITRRGLVPAGWRHLHKHGAILQSEALLDTIRANQAHDFTFAEASSHSGRSIAISVAPTRRGQRPRVLDPFTSPDALMAEAALASSSLHGLFPPATLMARDRDGVCLPYLPEERWADGSVGLDLPKHWLTRLYNADRFLVSQTNPHVLPFLTDPHRTSTVRQAMGAGGKALLHQTSLGLSLAASATADTPLRPYTSFAYALAGQDYTGNISIHPSFRPRWLTRIFTNPSRAELAAYILEGERATWPHLARIDATTRIERHLRSAIKRLSSPTTTESTS